jgi:phage gp45-like
MAELIERATLTARDEDSGTRLVQCSFAGGYQRSKLEHVEPYGFTTEPFKDGETDAVVVNLNENKSHSLVVMINDHRYRLTGLQDGEVCMYDDKKRKIYLKREGIEIDGVDDPVEVHTNGDIKVKSGANITLQADGKIDIKAAGNVNITGATINLN